VDAEGGAEVEEECANLHSFPSPSLDTDSIAKAQYHFDGKISVIREGGRVSYSSQLGGSGDLSPVGGGNPLSRTTDTQPLNNPVAEPTPLDKIDSIEIPLQALSQDIENLVVLK